MTTTMQVPNAEQVKGIAISYSGHGTQTGDWAIALGVSASIAAVLIVLIICTYLHYSRLHYSR